MKILLINPPVCNDIGRVIASTPPLGLLYLAAYLEKNNYSNIRVLDADAVKTTWSELKKILEEEKPDLIGITGASFVFPALVKTARIIRDILPDSVIIAGGFGPTTEPEKVLKSAGCAVDFVVLGEGEITLLELIKSIEKGEEDFKNIDGLAYLDQENLVTTNPREYIKDLDILPWPAYHLLVPDFTEYGGMHAQYKEMGRPVGILLASRGCPHRCTFCSLGSKMYRQRDPKDIVDEMEFLKNKFGLKSIQIYDDEFIGMSLQQNQWIEKICDEIITRGLNQKLTFLVQGRCSQFVELDVLKKMRQAGFRWIWWGVESGSQKVLDSINKDIRIDNITRDFLLAKQAGIKSMMFIMIGFPGETPADIKLTSNLIKKVNPDQVRIHILSPYPGSKLRKYLEENNLLDTDDYYKFDTRGTVIHHTKEMTSEEIKKYYRILVFRFENGYWYFIKFLFKSLMTIDGWKKLFERIKMIFEYLFGWLKVKFN